MTKEKLQYFEQLLRTLLVSKIKDARQSKKNLVEFNKEAPKYASPTIDGGYDSNDLGDMAQAMQEHTQHLISQHLAVKDLTEIEMALQRIKDGTYGICQHTGQQIPEARLALIPWTRYTAKAMQEIEEAYDA